MEWKVLALSVVAGAADRTYRYTLPGLRYNTTYQIRVTPYRSNGEVRETRNPTLIVELKTAFVGKGFSKHTLTRCILNLIGGNLE